MTFKTIFSTLFVALILPRLGLAQGGPFLVDHVWRGAWDNPAKEVTVGQLGSGVPETVVSIQTEYVPNTSILASKQKDYYWFQHIDKQSATIHQLQIDYSHHRAWIEFEGLYYPDNGGFSCEFEAIPLNELDAKCFAPLSGPYCHIPDDITYLGKVQGMPWVAFEGQPRKMGASFLPSQIDRILDENEVRHDGVLLSDLRAELVDEFLTLFPQFEASEIPVDEFSTLTRDADNEDTAVVCHIIPAIAPMGNAAGRNSNDNAMVVSSEMKKLLTNPQNGTGYLPSDAMLAYFEYLAATYGSKPLPTSQANFTAKMVRDPSRVAGDVEFLTEDETRVALQYLGMLKPPKTRR